MGRALAFQGFFIMVCVAIYAVLARRRSSEQSAQRIMVGSGIHRNPLFQPVQDRLTQ